MSWPFPTPGRSQLACALRLLRAFVLLAAVSPLPALACTEDRVLRLVGRLEAPDGYDTLYYGVRVRPSRPITTMSVAEVLAWQRRATRGGSVSTAAGRYQIIRPTLRRLVDEGMVTPSDRFDAATQDRLGRHLLRETGYRAGDTSATTANRIAGIWAALPDLSTGRSAYEGVAGNHALITAASWRGVLDCSFDIADVAMEIGTIRAGERFGFVWDRALEEMATAADRVMESIAKVGAGLLLGLFVIDLVIRSGRRIFAGALPGMMSGLVARLLVVALCLGVLRYPGELLGAVQRLAFAIAGTAGGGGFVLADYAAGRMVLVFSLLEGVMVYSAGIQAVVLVMALLIVIAGAFQIGLMIYWALNLVLTGAAGLLAVGFGGLQETTGAARAYMRHLIGAGLALLTALVVMAAVTGFVWELRAATSVPYVGAQAVLLMEIIGVALIWFLPLSVLRIAGGP